MIEKKTTKYDTDRRENIFSDIANEIISKAKLQEEEKPNLVASSCHGGGGSTTSSSSGC